MTRAATQTADAPPITVLNPIHADYFDSILPETPVICGLQLKPLSLGRYRLMARFKVAFVSDTTVKAHAGDLLMGCLICSMDCEDFVKFASQKDFKKECMRWGQKFGFYPPKLFSWPFIGRWLESRFGADIAKKDAEFILGQMRLFQKYINDGAPDLSKHFWSETGDGGYIGTHWCQNIEAILREHQGWTRKEIDEQPLSEGLWGFYKYLEGHGIGRFMTLEEIQDVNKKLTPDEEKEANEKASVLIDFLKAKAENEGRAYNNG